MKKSFSLHVFEQVQVMLSRFGVESQLKSRENIGHFMDIEPPPKDTKISIVEWMPTQQKSFLTEAQMLANFSYESRLQKERDFVKEVKNKLLTAAAAGETKVELDVPTELLTNAEACARVLGSVLVDGHFISLYGSQLRITLPPPCNVVDE